MVLRTVCKNFWWYNRTDQTVQSGIWPWLTLSKSSSFNRGPMSSRWEWMYWLIYEAHWSHWWSLRRSCTVDSTSTVVRGLQRGSPGSRLLGMPRIWRSRSATCEKYKRTVFFVKNFWLTNYLKDIYCEVIWYNGLWIQQLPVPFIFSLQIN